MYLHKLTRIGFVCLLFLLAVPADAQDTSVPVITDVQRLNIPNDASPRIFPAPDGRAIAYERAVRLNGHRDFYLCVSPAEAAAEPLCDLAPQPPARGFEPDPASTWLPFSWSPDSSQVAVVGQPWITQDDTDLLIFDSAAQSWRVLADDGYDGPLADAPAGVTVTTQPVWSPDGASIAAEQARVAEGGAFAPSALVVIDVASGDTRELALVFGADTETAVPGAVNGLAWSPDSTQLALSVRHRQPNAADGLWLVDVATGDADMLLPLSAVEAALNGVYAGLSLASVGPLTWSPDGTRLLLWAGDPGKTPAQVWPFAVDVDSAAITAVPLPAHPNDTPERRSVRPLQAVWSPDGARLLLLAFGRLPDEDAVSLDPADSSARLSVRLVDAASGEDSLLGYLPLGPSNALYLAAWGTGGDVITNGYALMLANDE
jgi:hypothetical protein